MISYTSEVLGELVIRENNEKYKISIRRGNCLAVFIYAYKKDGKWWHQLWSFFNDVTHIKCMMTNRDGRVWDKDLDVIRVRLNAYYKESMTIAKYMAKSGYKTELYYEVQKEEKKATKK